MSPNGTSIASLAGADGLTSYAFPQLNIQKAAKPVLRDQTTVGVQVPVSGSGRVLRAESSYGGYTTQDVRSHGLYIEMDTVVSIDGYGAGSYYEKP